ncbi:MAG: hypothetical protein R3E64_16365 [Halioglobus sp.]
MGKMSRGGGDQAFDFNVVGIDQQALSVSCSSKPWRSRQRPTRWLIS